MQHKVPFFDYPGLFAERPEAYVDAMRDAMERGAFIMQKDLAEFEKELAAYLGAKHAIGVADGTVALTLSLKAAGIGAGDEVILSSHTFIATAAAVHHVGATPVLCDCLPDSMMDPDSARRMVTDNTAALMPTQLNGRTCDMTALQAIADEYDLKIVEDSCQAMGARYDGTPAGLFGVAGSFSFFPAKTLGAFGDGGAIVLNDDDTAKYIRELRDHGRGPDGKVRQFGHNGRLDNLQATVLRLKLVKYDAAIARRRAVAARYEEGLHSINSLILPPPPTEGGLRFDIFQNYEIQAEERDALREFLAENGVGTIMQWGGWMIHQFDDLGLKADADYAEEMSKRFMMLPMHHLLSDDDVDYVIETIHRFYDRAA